MTNSSAFHGRWVRGIPRLVNLGELVPVGEIMSFAINLDKLVDDERKKRCEEAEPGMDYVFYRVVDYYEVIKVASGKWAGMRTAEGSDDDAVFRTLITAIEKELACEST